jgi:formate dehydrogenase subunit gamma
MSTATSPAPAIVRARTAEDVAIGDALVRHRLLSRRVHWSVALFFFLSLLSGLPIWTPLFGWLAGFFGGLGVCRWLHPITGLLFFVSSVVMFFLWLGDMGLEPQDSAWLGPKALAYMRNEEPREDVGKYNGGQKLFFYAVALGAVGLLASGLVLWFPESVPSSLRIASALLHDVTFVLFAIAIVLHIYLGTAAVPGTFHSMTRGTVTKAWARHHHPRWYREVTGDDPGR